MEEKVVLVDENCNELGLMGKMEAHQKGVLHKAISVIVFNNRNEMLVTQRAFTKYHWPGIWSNTCCSHPRDGESFSEAAHRRLKEELGFETTLREEFHFIYKAQDEQTGLIEHEFDTVFTGIHDGDIPFNQDEIAAVRWMQTDELLQDVKAHPGQYSFWFKIILDEFEKRGVMKRYAAN